MYLSLAILHMQFPQCPVGVYSSLFQFVIAAGYIDPLDGFAGGARQTLVALAVGHAAGAGAVVVNDKMVVAVAHGKNLSVAERG